MNVTDQDLTASEREALDRAMAVVEALPREAVDRVIRHALRVGLYFRRTGDSSALEALIRSLFHTVRQNRDDQYQKQVAASRENPAGSFDAEQVLATLKG